MMLTEFVEPVERVTLNKKDQEEESGKEEAEVARGRCTEQLSRLLCSSLLSATLLLIAFWI